MTAIEKMRAAMFHASTHGAWRPVVQRDPCVYCCAWPLPLHGGQEMTLEHIEPLSVGGQNNWRNLVGAHRACNETRSSMPLLHFLVYRQRVVGLTGKNRRRKRRRLRYEIWSPTIASAATGQ